jgi:hypothetical protein
MLSQKKIFVYFFVVLGTTYCTVDKKDSCFLIRERKRNKKREKKKETK